VLSFFLEENHMSATHEVRGTLGTIGDTNFVAPHAARLLVLSVVAMALAAGFLATNAPASALAVRYDGAALTRLVRFMAVVKAGLAFAAAGAVIWRLGVPARWPGLLAYAVSCGGMAAGPGLIWGMVHVGWGAALLHGGLLASVVLLWRDKAVAARLEAVVKSRTMRKLGGV